MLKNELRFDAGGQDDNFGCLPVSSLEGFPVQNNVLTEEIKINSKATSTEHKLSEDLVTSNHKRKASSLRSCKIHLTTRCKNSVAFVLLY